VPNATTDLSSRCGGHQSLDVSEPALRDERFQIAYGELVVSPHERNNSRSNYNFDEPQLDSRQVVQTREECRTMKSLFSPNIGTKGRVLRGLAALALLVGAWFAFGVSTWLGILLGASGVVGIFEAARGWCVLRACGIKTKF